MTYAISIVDVKGKKKDDYSLSTAIFSDDHVNESLLHEYVVMYLANQRQSTAHTKTRGQIRGSGRKLYRQKGTGRARVGNAASPIRRSGGVVFGPTNQKVWSKDMPQKMKRKALFGALTLTVKAEGMIGLDSFEVVEPKTKDAVAMLSALNLGGKKTLVVLDQEGEGAVKSLRNIKGVTVTSVSTLNAYEVMGHKNIVLTVSALKKLESMFTS